MIGLAQKAGKVASGEFSTEKAVKTGKAYTVIVGHAIGKEFRASLAVLDEGFAKTIEKYFEQGLE